MAELLRYFQRYIFRRGCSLLDDQHSCADQHSSNL